MSERDRERWDCKYRERHGAAAPPLASLAWLPEAASARDTALDLACGTGRHLASIRAKGYRVIAADVSIVALRRVPVTSAEIGAVTGRVSIDSESWAFGPQTFALIVQTDFLDRGALADIKTSLRAGGAILIDTFSGPGGPDRPGPSNAAYRLREGELREMFAEWRICRHEFGRHREAILVRKPERP